MDPIARWLSNQLPDVRSNLSVVSGQFLHISDNPAITSMRPRIGDRQLKDEDRTIPRVCGGMTVDDCIYGHAGIHRKAVKDPKYLDANDKFNGIWTVYEIPVKQFLRPKSALVADAPDTNEVWLVPYTPELLEVKVNKIGELILANITTTVDCGETTDVNQFLFKCDRSVTIGRRLVGPGFYSFSINGKLAIGIDPKRNPVMSLTKVSAVDWTTAVREITTNYKSG